MDARPLDVNRIALSVRGRARSLPEGTRRVLVRRLRRAMRAAKLDADVSLTLSDDRELHALNAQYANEDHATDVLSFRLADAAHAIPTRMLGDVIISVEYAARQAKKGLPAELFHLAVHGLAHLLGYDHRDAVEERVMFGYEEKLRASALAPGDVKRISAPRSRPA